MNNDSTATTDTYTADDDITMVKLNYDVQSSSCICCYLLLRGSIDAAAAVDVENTDTESV